MADHDIVRTCSISLYDTRAWPSIPPAHARGEAVRLPLIVFSTRCQSGKNVPQILDHPELINISGLESERRLTCILAPWVYGRQQLLQAEEEVALF